MKIRRILVSLLALVCLCTPVSIAYAETADSFVDDGISLAYEIANEPQTRLSITTGTAICTSTVKGQKAVSIAVTHTLQKYGSSDWYDNG